MKLKCITFSAVFLFFLGTTSAQTIPFSRDNTVDITILVKDTLGAQGSQQSFEFIASETQTVHTNSNVRFRVKLDYQSSVDNISYFRLYYKLTSEVNGFTVPNHGITVPVLIPPVRKDSTRVHVNNLHLGSYPYVITTNYVPTETSYTAQFDLVKYENELDYIYHGNHTNGPSLPVHLITNAGTLPSSQGSRNHFSITTYPNPSNEFVTIDRFNASTENIPLQKIPLQVTLFNRKGIRVISYNLMPISVKNNTELYRLDITQLPKGMYFCKIKHGKNTHVKTIVKK
ncbi:hypothetical protein IMCC3317_31380 [Kordia antarctica]|uniref:Secretion system C-terminal sorting domain-containing protein n=1 Tax=Kordia antarctica TaxID=1218801 RepID=A0A7L4ZMP8_9FLAO|nr:T9SS type A sorting domain-containing protein [Kordia antarctica]QHI37757.1 hypothetical protein IMCC3317_31380 [Kordia antarctica]